VLLDEPVEERLVLECRPLELGAFGLAERLHGCEQARSIFVGHRARTIAQCLGTSGFVTSSNRNVS
jgi:hypothetical protein